jgi:hypothetical protein
VDLEDGLAADAVREVHGHAAVEAPRSEKCLVQHVRAVRRLFERRNKELVRRKARYEGEAKMKSGSGNEKRAVPR